MADLTVRTLIRAGIVAGEVPAGPSVTFGVSADGVLLEVRTAGGADWMGALLGLAAAGRVVITSGRS